MALGNLFNEFSIKRHVCYRAGKYGEPGISGRQSSASRALTAPRERVQSLNRRFVVLARRHPDEDDA